MATEIDIDEAIGKVLHDFKVCALKPEQKEILNCLLDNRDCMAVLPAGFGKSLPYQMQVSVRMELGTELSDIGKVVVCSPLVALMQDQVDRLNNVPNVTAAYKGLSQDRDEKILKGEFNYVFASPETLIGDKVWRMKFQQMNVSTIVIDEFHTICTWGGVDQLDEESAFRKWFKYIGELRSMFPTACILALSATCTKTMQKSVLRELHMQKETTTFISKSPNKPNIKFCVQKIENTIDMSMVWLMEALDKLKATFQKFTVISVFYFFPRTIVYATTIKQLSELYKYICEEVPNSVNLIDMFHSETPDEKKKDIITKLQDPDSDLRIIFATSALGMGIDIVNFNSCILYGAPSSVVDLVQEVGRIVRNGENAVAMLLYNRYHLIHVDQGLKSIYTSQTCVRLKIMPEFLTKSELKMLQSGTHNCCSICEQKCNCGKCEQIFIQRFYELGIDDNQDTSSSSNTDLYYRGEESDIPDELFEDF